MQDSLGGAENYKKAYLEKLDEVFASGEDLDITVNVSSVSKQPDGNTPESSRVIAQKQEGLYTVIWHPIGGQPSVESFCRLAEYLAGIRDAEIRLSPDESAYIVNLTGKEAEKVLELTKDGAESLFETSVSCIGASICQIGLRDSQELLLSCVKAVLLRNTSDRRDRFPWRRKICGRQSSSGFCALYQWLSDTGK